MVRVYAFRKDDYGSETHIRVGRMFRHKQAGIRLANTLTRAYVTDDSSGKELAFHSHGILTGTQITTDLNRKWARL